MMTQNAFKSFEQKSSFTSVSRLDPEKGQDQLIHAMECELGVLGENEVTWQVQEVRREGD